MLTIHVLERGAKERESLTTWFHGLLNEENAEIEFVPRVDLKPVSLEELQFAGTPDLCILGPALLEEDLTCIRKIREVIKKVPLLACTSPRLESLAHVEQLARLGVNDTISMQDVSLTFLRKLILLSRNKKEERKAKLVVVESGKGGVGVTTVAAALGELSSLYGNKTVLIDLDFETQDLTRFLQAPPFVNENFQLILEGSRPLCDEAVEQCLCQVWEDDPSLFHIAPPPESELLYASDSKTVRLFLAFLEFLDERFECIVIDSGCMRGALQKTLHRVADEVVFILNNDPATLYASVDRFRKVQENTSSSGRLTILDNGCGSGLPRRLLISEFERVLTGSEKSWAPFGIPFCRRAAKWPASGGTFLSLSRNSAKDAFEQLAIQLELVNEDDSEGSLFRRFMARIQKKRGDSASVAQSEEHPIIAAAAQDRKKDILTHVKALPEPKVMRDSGVRSPCLIDLMQQEECSEQEREEKERADNNDESDTKSKRSFDAKDANSLPTKIPEESGFTIGDLISGVTIR